MCYYDHDATAADALVTSYLTSVSVGLHTDVIDVINDDIHDEHLLFVLVTNARVVSRFSGRVQYITRRLSKLSKA